MLHLRYWLKTIEEIPTFSYYICSSGLLNLKGFLLIVSHLELRRVVLYVNKGKVHRVTLLQETQFLSEYSMLHLRYWLKTIKEILAKSITFPYEYLLLK
ncbi:hypothetical protein RclHR1_02370015 [Rhizophagus clarus]|uniref:Uncharacterized protein n=1 Tax=Rhizophagus clarus TaxID=94130 RepID=A0A2Z6QY64_9GLOM|nr:hypothetical protein RclHR1_02370015 [Rhizophagus clarus]GES78473.1 hypothetical protein RCL_e9834_RclHR1_02370015 [Rhizophagus clarus]